MTKRTMEKCRFALAIDEDGQWCVYGHSNSDGDDDNHRNAAEDFAIIHKVYHLEIEVPVPTAEDFPTIKLNATFAPPPVSEVAVTVEEAKAEAA